MNVQATPLVWQRGFASLESLNDEIAAARIRLAIIRRKIEESNEDVCISKIRSAVADFYGVTVAEILSRRRNLKVSKARHVAIYVSRKLTRRTMPEIARMFGDRDHTTILYAIHKYAGLVQSDAALAAEVASITNGLG